VRVIGRTLLSHLGNVGDLSADDRAAILELDGEVRSYRRHEDIIKTGKASGVSVVVIDGFLQRYANRRDGSRQILSFYIPTDAPSLESLHFDRADDSLCAVVPSEVGLVPHSDLHRLTRERPNVMRLIWRSVAVQSCIYRQWLSRNSRLPADAAMAHLFCEIYTRCSAAGLVDGGSCGVPLTQEMLADALGLTGVHVNRMLQTLRDKGAVDHKGGRLFVYDFKQLAHFADFDPAYLHLDGKAPPRT
jgi:CRP-like cAMP-binding protein